MKQKDWTPFLVVVGIVALFLFFIQLGIRETSGTPAVLAFWGMKGFWIILLVAVAAILLVIYLLNSSMPQGSASWLSIISVVFLVIIPVCLIACFLLYIR
jgi:hypothetical protein